MSQSSVEFLTSIFELDGSTMFLLYLICGSAIWIIRDKVSIFIMAGVFPLAMLVSMTAYRSFDALAWFNTKNMGEWLVWVVFAGTIGTVGIIGAAAALAHYTDRRDKRPALKQA